MKLAVLDRLRCRVIVPISRKINMEHGVVTKPELRYRKIINKKKKGAKNIKYVFTLRRTVNNRMQETNDMK